SEIATESLGSLWRSQGHDVGELSLRGDQHLRGSRGADRTGRRAQRHSRQEGSLQEHAGPGDQVSRPRRRLLLPSYGAVAEAEGSRDRAQTRLDGDRLDSPHVTIRQEARET